MVHSSLDGSRVKGFNLASDKWNKMLMDSALEGTVLTPVGLMHWWKKCPMTGQIRQLSWNNLTGTVATNPGKQFTGYGFCSEFWAEAVVSDFVKCSPNVQGYQAYLTALIQDVWVRIVRRSAVPWCGLKPNCLSDIKWSQGGSSLWSWIWPPWPCHWYQEMAQYIDGLDF